MDGEIILFIGMKRKFIYMVLIPVLMLGLSLTVSAYTVTPSVYRDTIEGYDEAYLRMYKAIAACEESADLTDLRIRDKDAVQIYSDIVGSCPEFFYLADRVAYGYTSSGLRRNVTKMNFIYTMDGEELERARMEYETELAYIVSLTDPAMSDAEKALWVHDYLISVTAYDESMTVFNAYGLFTGRTGVCQAYSLAYAAVMRELGVETVMVSSREMNHAWNQVKIGEHWYHVDLVYDDPAPDKTGRVNHDNFLLSDAGIAETMHYGWESSLKCGDESFADNIWDGVTARMVYLDGQWYYIDEETSTLAASLFDGRYRLEVYRFTEKWYVKGMDQHYWLGLHSGLADCLGHLMFNTPDRIMIYNPETGKMDIYMELPDIRIFGLDVCKNTLEYFAADSPEPADGEVRRYTVSDANIGSTVTILPFDDVNRMDPRYPAVRFVYEKGLFQGVSADRFAPDATLTRAMFVTVLGRLCGIDAEQYTEIRYTDVEAEQWYTPYVEWASREGIVNGIGGGLFDPMGEITHEQMYKIVARCGVRRGAGDMNFTENVLLYEDAETISDWALDGISYCMVNDLIEAEPGEALMPQEKATRGEAAEIVSRFALLGGIA